MKHADATSDADLLQRYLRTREEALLRTLMQRHLPLVYSVALRASGSPELATEVAQDVFVQLIALPTALMKKGTPLTAWLHRTARHRAVDRVRSEAARKKRELLTEPPGDARADALPPEALALLDAVIQQLPQRDRELVLQRYFLGRPLGDIGTDAGLSEDAVRMRLKRSLEKMKDAFHARGISTTAAILAGSLPLQGIVPLPASLATAIELKVLTGAAAVATAIAKPTIPSLVFLMTTTQKCIVGASVLLVAGVVGTATIREGTSKKNALLTQMAEREKSELPSPPPAVPATKSLREETAEKDNSPELTAKYGQSRTRRAVNLAGRAGTLVQDFVRLQFIEAPADQRRLQYESSLEDLGKALSLRPEQQAAFNELLPDYEKEYRNQAIRLKGLAEKNKGAVAESFLALDAWKQGEITDDEFHEIARRTRGELSIGHTSAIDFLGIAALGMDFQDPLIDFPDIAAKLESQLDPAQPELYREKRAKNEELFTVHYQKTSLDDIASTLEGMKKMLEAQRLLKPGEQ